MELKGKKICFLGDSITEGHGVSCKDNIYCNILAQKYAFTAYNYGIGGTRIARQQNCDCADCDKYYASRVNDMDPDADAVVVFGGTNDYGHGDAKLGCFTDRTPDTFYGACHDLFERLINKYPGKPIIIMTPLHRTNEFSPGINKEPNAEAPTLVKYVDIILEVARYYSMPVCDLYAESGIQPNVRILMEKFCPDGLHPNDAGQMLIAKKLERYLLNA